MDADEYARYESECLAEFEVRQRRIAETSLFEQREVDLQGGLLRFFHDSEPYLEGQIALLGSWGGGRPRFRWGWANPSLDGPAREATAAVRELHALTGNPEFADDAFIEISERRAWALAAIAQRHLGGEGVYTFLDDGVRWFLLVRSLRSLKSEAELLKRAAAVAHERLLEPIVSADAPAVWSGVDLANVPEAPNATLAPPPSGVSAQARFLNFLRQRFPELRLCVPNADLRGTAQAWAGDLHVQSLVDFGYLTTHATRDLHGVDLTLADLDGVILRGVKLSGARFDNASLVGADLSGADVRGASFRGAFLNGANFARARLAGADFTGAELSRTILAFVDLSAVQGLDEVRHLSPSEISFSTLTASEFKLTPTFLRRAGVSRGLLQDLARGQRFPGRYETCFLSYSSKDAEFAGQIYQSLTEAGVRVFWDRFDVLPGEYLENQIAEAINEHDRLLIVLSPHSMASEWVKREIAIAWGGKRKSLLPIRLTPIEDVKAWTASDVNLPDLAGAFPIQDFSGWRDRSQYDHAFSLLLKSFSGGVDVRARKRRATAKTKKRGGKREDAR